MVNEPGDQTAYCHKWHPPVPILCISIERMKQIRERNTDQLNGLHQDKDMSKAPLHTISPYSRRSDDMALYGMISRIVQREKSNTTSNRSQKDVEVIEQTNIMLALQTPLSTTELEKDRYNQRTNMQEDLGRKEEESHQRSA